MKILHFTFFVILLQLTIFGICSGQNSLEENEKSLVEELKDELLKDNEQNELKLQEYTEHWVKKTPFLIMTKWLKYHDYDIEKSKNQIEKSLKWKSKNDIDNIIHWEPSEFIANTFKYRITVTDEGLPVIYAAIGKWPLRKALSEGYRTEIVKYMIKMVEEGNSGLHSSSSGNVDGVIYIADMQDFSLYDATSLRTLSLATIIINIFEQNYPLQIKAAYIINAPSYFSLLFDLVKRIFSSKTLQTIQIFSNYPQDLIESNVPLSSLPIHLGGELDLDLRV